MPMDIKELYKYAYLKKPLNDQFQSPAEVPFEFLLEWFKDTFDYQRIHSEEEMEDFINAILEDRDPISGIDLAYEVVEVIYAAYLSGETGKRVELAKR